MINASDYEDLLCIDCKKNIAAKMNSLKHKELLKAQLRPKRFAKKTADWICSDCRSKISARLRK